METSSVYTIRRIPENLVWSELLYAWVTANHAHEYHQKVFLSPRRAKTTIKRLYKYPQQRVLNKDANSLIYLATNYSMLDNENFQLVLCEHKLLLSYTEIVRDK